VSLCLFGSDKHRWRTKCSALSMQCALCWPVLGLCCDGNQSQPGQRPYKRKESYARRTGAGRQINHVRGLSRSSLACPTVFVVQFSAGILALRFAGTQGATKEQFREQILC
jgi:hypothetical protein